MQQEKTDESGKTEIKEVKGDIDDLIFDEYSSKHCSEK